MKDLQKYSTRVFITASALFGLVGAVAILTTTDDSDPAVWLMKCLAALGFIVLGSFGISVGLKYLTK